MYINIYTRAEFLIKKEKRKKEKNFLDDVNSKDSQKSNS